MGIRAEEIDLFSMRATRRFPEALDQRSPYRRDYDRILYSREFRRLSGVTQVARAGEHYIYHDRLSHSLKVAQVARSLANVLQDRLEKRWRNTNYWIDEDVVQTAALAHDIGHPPFGHAAEKTLNELVDDDDGGFEGNAQSFRILTKLARHKQSYPGLNLTRASLNAVLKYPFGIDEGPKNDKWGYYPTEEREFEWAREFSNRKHEKSIEADIMDYADDLTYAIHDVDDFYRAGLVPLNLLLSNHDSTERDRFKNYLMDEKGISKRYVEDFFVNRLRSIADPELDTPFDGSDENIAAINKLTSTLIEQYLGVNQKDAVRLDVKDGELVMKRHEEFEKDITILKQLTFYYVITDNKLISQQHGQCKIIEELFSFFKEQVTARNPDFPNIVPSPYRERLDELCACEETRQVRNIVDLITSLTEQQTIQLYQRLSGQSPGSLREGIIQ